MIPNPEDHPSPPESEMQDYTSLLEQFNQMTPPAVKPEPQNERIESMEARLQKLETQQAPASNAPAESLSGENSPEAAASVAALEATCSVLSNEVRSLQNRLDTLQSELATRFREIQRSQEQLEQHLSQLPQEAVEQHGSDRERALLGFWDGLTTLQKLECLALSLPEISRLTRSLRAAKETAALLDPSDMLLKWALKYPSACAEKLGVLFTPLLDNGSESERLTVLTLTEMRARLEATLLALALRYDSPPLGAPVSSLWETLGEEVSAHPRGTVARVVRGGLSHQGRNLIAPAVMVSNGEKATETQVATPPPPPSETVEPNLPQPPVEKPEAYHGAHGPTPLWLTTLQTATLGSQNPEENRLLEVFESLVASSDSTELLEPLESVLPLLSPCRHFYALPVSEAWRGVWEKILPEFTVWLKTERSITPISPSSKEGIDETLMEVTETRQTLHEAERDHISRLERPGARRGARVLFRAQVQAYRYERG